MAKYSSYGRRGGKSSYKYTARRAQALRRAQYISAQKRKRRGKIAKVAGVGVLAAAGVGAGVYLGRNTSGTQIKESVKSATKLGTDLVSAFRAVDPVRKEKTRKQVAISKKASARRRKDEATRRHGTREVLKPVGKSERKDLMAEATKPLGPNALDESTFNPDGTVTKNAIVGVPNAKDLRSGIAKSSRARARSGGKGLTNKEKNEIFKRLQAGLPASEAVTPTTMTGKKTPSLLPKIPAGNQSNAYSGDPLHWLANQRQADDDLLREHREK